MKNKAGKIALSIAVWAVCIISSYFLLIKTPAVDTLFSNETALMLVELLITSVWVFLAFFVVDSDYLRIGIIVVVVYISLWIHRIALPIVISGMFAIALIVIGDVMLSFISGRRPVERIVRFNQDFLIGSAVQVSLVGIVSAFGIGGVVTFRIEFIVLTVLAVGTLILFRLSKKRIPLPMGEMPSEEELKEESKSRVYICIAMALIAACVLMQAGRINIALDYDSLHYGLRSPYVLDNGHGIYENLGSVNDVYVYSKGLEMLLLPLNAEVTYGYVTAYSWWMMVGVLANIYYAVKKHSSRKTAIYAVLVTCLIPAIMNMSVSAKTDMITLLIQLIALSFFIDENLFWGYGALAFSLIFKPTSFLFSAIIGLVSLIYFVIKKTEAEKNGNEANLKTFFAVAVPVICALGFVFARTIILTGVPVASVGGSIWEALGFSVKYPFDAIDAFGKDYSLVKRIAGFLFCPVGDDLTHVYIAWGGILGTLLCVWALFAKKSFLKWLFLGVAAGSAFCVLTLYQVDGNYFMLLYALAVIVTFSDSNDAKCRVKIFIPAMIMGGVLCCITNWAGVKGLTPIKLNHYGFYDHQSDRYDAMFANQSKDIYEYLSRDESSRVIAFAWQPECFDFECNVQSYTDIEGSGGNVYLVKTLDEFKGYLNYAKTDYVYTEEEFLETHSRGSDIITYMIEDGSLQLELDEGNNKLYAYIQK